MDVNAILTTDGGKLSFLKGLIRLAKCDGVVDNNELLFFQQAASAVGLGEDAKLELNGCWKTNAPISVEFDNTQQRNFFFIQAIQLCWIDGSYTDNEKKEIRQIAQETNTGLETIKKIENWVHEGILWNKKGDELLEL